MHFGPLCEPKLSAWHQTGSINASNEPGRNRHARPGRNQPWHVIRADDSAQTRSSAGSLKVWGKRGARKVKNERLPQLRCVQSPDEGLL
jgi:hypothetical protein